MSLVEDAYRRFVDAMTPAQRIERMVNLNALGRDVIERQILAECGDISQEQLKCKVAMRLYGDDPQSRRLIEKALAHVST